MKRNRPKEKEPSKGDWRHAIFRRVVSPTKSASPSLKSCPKVQAGPVQTDVLDGPLPKTTRTRDEIRNLWKNAIHQQILLNRMDKENYLLKAKQEEALGKRVKLSYETIGVCDEEANDTWDLITVKAQKHPGTPCDLQLLDSAILRGIPKHKRGQVWQFFSQQRDLFPDYSNRTKFTPKKDFSYGYLRRQLTSHQHAILIDLGRTFPSHPFFCDPLGTGQLALFNLLKAYSILDPDVGYCQGLSFVAGILLMHYEEEEAFSMLKYFMFDLGAREHYKPEMDGLQIKMYQLTRMIHDQDPELHRFLDEQDILPTLYAAPWFLTMFAAHFSVGFSVRVLDVAFLHGLDMITKFAVLIIVDHRNDLIRCNGLEQIMDCFRHVVTQFGSDDVDRYLKKVLEGDSDKQLLTYAAEYSVMHESFISSMNNESPCPTLKKPENLQVPGRINCEECLRLQTDLRNLVDFVASSGLDIEHKCPPEVSALVAKYTTRGNNGSKSEFRCDTSTRSDGVSTVPLLIDNRETGSDPNAMLYHSGSSSDELSRESSPSNSTFPVLPSKREGNVGSKKIAQNFLIY